MTSQDRERTVSFITRNLHKADDAEAIKMVQHVEKHSIMDNSDNEEEDEFKEEENNEHKNPSKMGVHKAAQPKSYFSFVARLSDRQSFLNMEDTMEKTQSKVAHLLGPNSLFRQPEVVSDVRVEPPPTSAPTAQQQQTTEKNDLEDIRQKVLEHEQQQLKGVQFANAGNDSLKVINNYSITSTSCNLI